MAATVSEPVRIRSRTWWEPYHGQIGLLARTWRGRQLTELGLAAPGVDASRRRGRGAARRASSTRGVFAGNRSHRFLVIGVAPVVISAALGLRV